MFVRPLVSLAYGTSAVFEPFLERSSHGLATHPAGRLNAAGHFLARIQGTVTVPWPSARALTPRKLAFARAHVAAWLPLLVHGN